MNKSKLQLLMANKTLVDLLLKMHNYYFINHPGLREVNHVAVNFNDELKKAVTDFGFPFLESLTIDQSTGGDFCKTFYDKFTNSENSDVHRFVEVVNECQSLLVSNEIATIKMSKLMAPILTRDSIFGLHRYVDENTDDLLESLGKQIEDNQTKLSKYQHELDTLMCKYHP